MNPIYPSIPDKSHAIFNLLLNGLNKPLKFVKMETFQLKTEDKRKEGVRFYFTSDEEGLTKFSKQFNVPLVDGCYIVVEAPIF